MPRPHPPNLQDIKKKPWKRGIFWVVLLIIGLLGDEYIKEGYLFDPADIPIYGTHEFFVIVLSIIGGLIWLSQRFWKRRERM